MARRQQMATPQLVDEDNEDDDFSVDVTSSRPSIGLPGGRAMRPQSPVMVSLVLSSFACQVYLGFSFHMLLLFWCRLRLHLRDVHNQQTKEIRMTVMMMMMLFL